MNYIYILAILVVMDMRTSFVLIGQVRCNLHRLVVQELGIEAGEQATKERSSLRRLHQHNPASDTNTSLTSTTGPSRPPPPAGCKLGCKPAVMSTAFVIADD